MQDPSAAVCKLRALQKNLAALTADAYKTDYTQVMEVATEIREQAAIVRMWAFEKHNENRPDI